VENAACPLSLIIDIDAVPVDDQLLHRINKLNPYCRVLILSTRSFHPELKESLRRNIFAVINKSSTHNELHTCLQALLESSQIPGYTGKNRDK
jgi:DNA-binding NarL/FixJ family response regulator